MAITSKEINLTQLDKELGSKGLVSNIIDPNNKIIKISDKSTVSEADLEAAIASHVAISTSLTVSQKLAIIGITIPDLKTALM